MRNKTLLIILSLLFQIGMSAQTTYGNYFSMILKKAEEGKAQQQAEVGYHYEYGITVSIDYDKALYWYKKSAEQGCEYAENNLGIMYLKGKGMPKDYAEALKWFRKAAEKGHTEGLYNVGICYHNGQGVEKDYTQAAYWFRKAARKGYEEAKNWLKKYEDGGIYKEFKIKEKSFYISKRTPHSKFRLFSFQGEDVLNAECDTLMTIGEDYIKAKNNGVYSIFSIDGKEIIPTSRGYTSIDYDSSQGTFAFKMPRYTGKCDAQGNEISLTKLTPTVNDIKAEGGYASAVEMMNGSIKYYKVSKGGKYGLTSSEGKVIVPVEMEALESAGTGYLRFKIGSFWGVMNYAGKIIIPTDRGYTKIGDYVSFTKRFPYEMFGYKGECNNLGVQVSKIKVATPVSQQTQTATTQTTTQKETTSQKQEEKKIIIEHHHDPIPVQQWQACWACGGMGTMGCDNCGGSGTKYIGDRLHRCSRCNGGGIIPCNVCYGNKGQYITVYQ